MSNRKNMKNTDETIKKERIKWNYIVLLLILFCGILYYFANVKRVESGYFENSSWIFLSDFLYVIFFGLISGFVIGFLINKVTKYDE